MPESPVKETVAADRIVFAFSESVETQIDRTPVVISRAATSGRVRGESMSSANSARTEKRMTNPPTCVMTAKLSMMELLTEVMKDAREGEGSFCREDASGTECATIEVCERCGRDVTVRCCKLPDESWAKPCVQILVKQVEKIVCNIAASREESGTNNMKQPISSGRCNCTSAT